VKKTEPPNQEEFEALLAWLDPDRGLAGERYEEIRRKLIRILVRRQCHAAEELADETINRVSHRVQGVANTYVGDPALYFYGVAKKVYKEWLRWLREANTRLDAKLLPPRDPSEDVERIYAYLERCRQELDPEDGELILKYYEKQKRAKIDHRKKLADGLGITLNSLRMRVHRINLILQKCIVDCLNDTQVTGAGHVFAG
jgi:DNA-directed RNA polymerase specialized sigma24 family protein